MSVRDDLATLREWTAPFSTGSSTDARAALARVAARVEELEAQVAALTQERDEAQFQANGWRACAEDADGVLFVKRAEAAEAALADTRRALDRLIEAAEVFVPERRYEDEYGDNLERAVIEARALLAED